MSPAPAAGYSRRPRLDKLGVKPGMRVALVGLDDRAFRAELRTRTNDISEGRPRAATDLVLFAVAAKKALARLTALRKRIRPAGAIWVLWRKGRKELREDDIRGAALAQGLVDVKVIAFSEERSGLKLVIPLALRPAEAKAGATPRTKAPAARRGPRR